MWRVFYNEETGIIRYMIETRGVTGSEPWPYIDFENRVDLKDRKVDVVTKELVLLPPNAKVVFPTRTLNRKLSSQQ